LNGNPNFEVKSLYNIKILSTADNSSTIENDFTILVNDLNEQPIDITISENTIDENV
jgi:hypothetical protein